MDDDVVEDLGHIHVEDYDEPVVAAAVEEIIRLRQLCGALATTNAKLVSTTKLLRDGRRRLEQHYKNEISRIKAGHISEAHAILLLKQRVRDLEEKMLAAGLHPGATTLPASTQKMQE